VRLFVALYPPAEAVNDLVEQVGRLRIGEFAASGINVRLSRPENLHVTLAFLGEVEDTRLPVVGAALERAARTWRRPTDAAKEDGPPRVRLAGGGRFGRGRFTVLWTGLTGDVDALNLLSRAVRRELRRSRIRYDEKPFRPHLTIARPGDRVDRDDIVFDLSTLNGYLGPSWPVTEMVLVRTHLGPPPTYDRLAVWSL
jgi:RNA 2',3'-cyclic 3'-phosphodiesterase